MSTYDVTPDRMPELGTGPDEPDVATRHADGHDVEVRRNGTLFAAMALVCLAVALAYFVRAFGGGGAASWLVALVITGLGVVMGLSWWESKTPMLVADAFGIRIRLGREWRGLPWAAIEQVVVEPRTSVLHDGRLVVVPVDESDALDGLDAAGRRQVALSQKVYGAALVVPLGMTTRVSVPRLVDALADLAGTRSAVVELAGWAAEPVVPMDADHLERRETRARVAIAAGDGTRMGAGRTALGDARARTFEGLSLLEDLGRSVGRTVGSGVSSGVSSLVARFERVSEPEVHRSGLDVVMVDGTSALRLDPLVDEMEDETEEQTGEPGDTENAGDELGHVEHQPTEQDSAWDADWERAPRPARAEVVGPEPEPVEEPEPDPEIGSRLRAARLQLGYDVRALSERTRIQPHVIEAVEADDFHPCGGDFYARGHLRSLCTVLGVPAAGVVASFDRHHAAGPVDAKRVFSAELATGRPRDGAGRRWAIVLVVVLTLVLAWGLARLFTDQPQALSTPTLDGSAGLASQRAPITSVFGAPVSMSVRGVGGSSKVVVRDHTGLVMWTGTLHAGVHRQLSGVAPFEVTAGTPDNVQVWVAGKNRGNVVADNAVVGRQTRTFGR